MLTADNLRRQSRLSRGTNPLEITAANAKLRQDAAHGARLPARQRGQRGRGVTVMTSSAVTTANSLSATRRGLAVPAGS